MLSRKLYCALLVAALASAGAIAQPAAAQTRVQATPKPTPPAPGIQKPNVDPTHQAIAALSLKVESLRQSAGRQVVVLHFPPTPTTSWADSDNNFPNNTSRAEKMCKDALGDRYGRVLSRLAEPDMANNRWYFPNLVCETAP